MLYTHTHTHLRAHTNHEFHMQIKLQRYNQIVLHIMLIAEFDVVVYAVIVIVPNRFGAMLSVTIVVLFLFPSSLH